MARIFLSYRRDDTSAIVGRIYDRLQAKFGRDAVFMDVDAVPFGVDFRVHIGNAVTQCDVLLVIMGEHWVSVTAGDTRRLDDPTDFVRIEIEAALAADVAVIPVLVGSTTMPRSEMLPGRLADLAYRNAASLDVGRDFNVHMDRLIRAVEDVLRIRAARAPARTAEPEAGAGARPDGATPDGAERHSHEAIASIVEESLRQVVVESGAGMGGGYVNSPNLHQVWRRLHERLHGSEIPALCAVLGEAHPFQIHWITLNFLEISAQLVADESLQTRMLNAARDHVPKGGHLQKAALSLIQSLVLPREAVFEPLLLAARVTKPDHAVAVVDALCRLTPPSKTESAAAAVVRILGKLPADSHHGKRMVDVIRTLGHRGVAAELRRAMTQQPPETVAAIATLLADWKDQEAASYIREYIEVNHASVADLHFLETLRALYRLEGPSSCRYIAGILCQCGPFVQQHLGSHYLGELRQEPLIVEAIKDIFLATKDPEVRKGLASVVETPT